MKVMNKLTTLTLTAAIVPALTFGGAVFASEHDDTGLQNDENRTGEQQTDGQGFDQQQSDEHGFDQQQSDDQGLDRQQDDEHQFDGQDSDTLGMDDQRDEEFMSNKPAGALYADDLIGKNVKHRQTGDNVGEITDLIIGEDGRIAGVVVTTGTFLGLGGQEVSMSWDQLQHSMEDDDSVFYTDMDEDSLKNAPEYNRD